MLEPIDCPTRGQLGRRCHLERRHSARVKIRHVHYAALRASTGICLSSVRLMLTRFNFKHYESSLYNCVMIPTLMNDSLGLESLIGTCPEQTRPRVVETNSANRRAGPTFLFRSESTHLVGKMRIRQLPIWGSMAQGFHCKYEQPGFVRWSI